MSEDESHEITLIEFLELEELCYKMTHKAAMGVFRDINRKATEAKRLKAKRETDELRMNQLMPFTGPRYELKREANE